MSEALVRSEEIRLHVRAEPGADRARAAELTWALEDELRDPHLPLELDSVEHVKDSGPPAGAKGSAFEWAQLLLTVSGSLPALVAFARSWLDRHDTCELTLELGGNRLTLAHGSSEDQRSLVESWLAAHAPKGD